MSKQLELAPFAVTSDGTLFVNVATFTAATDLEAVVRAAQVERGAVFIGVMLSPDEAGYVMARFDNTADETAARLAGQRRRRATTRKRRATRS